MISLQYKYVQPANLCDGNEIKINIVARIETGKHQYGYGS